MDLVVSAAHGEAEISVLATPTGASLGDLVRHTTGTAPPRVCVVDGRPVTAATPLADVVLVTGSTISTSGDGGDPPEDVVAGLVQVAGRGAGALVALGTGRYLVGPGTRANASELDLGAVEDARFELEIAADGRVRVLARTGVVRLDGVVVEGSGTAWTRGLLDTGHRVFRLVPPRITPPARPRPADGSATVPFNRPPRPAPAPPWQLPDPPERAGSRRAELERVSAALAEGREAELDRLRGAHPDPAEIADLARRSDASLWQRRPADPDGFRFAVGLADLPWSISDGGAADVVATRYRTLPMVPVVADLDEQPALAVVGPPGLARSIARSVLLEAVVAHGPADLDLAVLTSTDRAASWEWTKWLPHSRTAGPPVIMTTRDDVEDWVAGAPSAQGTGDRRTLVVVDEPAWWRDRTSPLRPLLADRERPLRWIVLVESPADVPAVCTTTVTARTDGTASVQDAQAGSVDDVIAYHTGADAALATARWLAALDDPDRPGPAGPPLPVTVHLDHLTGAADAALVVQRWASRSGGLPVALGVGEQGIVEVDLVTDGPHALLAASDGDELGALVQTSLVGLASASGPERLALVLVADDPEVFGRCTALPHVVSVVTAAGRHGAERVVRSLRAELARRTAESTSDTASRPDPLPDVVVALADVAVIGRSDPSFATSILDIAEHGASVGLHLLLATALPQEAVPFGAVRGVRVSRRLRGEAAPLATLGLAAAGELPRFPPGRAVVRTGDGTSTTVQTPSLTDDRFAGSDEFVVRPFVVARERSAMEHRIGRAADRAALGMDDASALGRLLDAMATAAATVVTAPHPPMVVEVLPPTLDLRAFFDAHPGDGVPYGLVDLPDDQRQDTAWWRPGTDGHLLVYGAAGTGATSLLVTLALGIAERFAPDDVHLYVLDADPERNDALLAPLAGVPHCGALVRADEVDRLAALLRLIDDELDRRAGAPPEAANPVIVAMVDDLAALRRVGSTRRDLDGTWARIERILHEGASVGVVAVLTTSDARAVGGMAAAVPTRLAMRLDASGRSTADHLAEAELGVDAGRVAAFGRGRALRLDDHTEVQLVRPPDDIGAAIEAIGFEPAQDRPPRRVEPDAGQRAGA